MSGDRSELSQSKKVGFSVFEFEAECHELLSALLFFIDVLSAIYQLVLACNIFWLY